MADYTPAHLRIGGEIANEQYLEIQHLTDAGAESSVGQLYEIWHDRARTGEFEALEAYLTEQGIPFDRYSEPALGYGGRLAQFRPGMQEPVEFTASGDNRERVVPVRAIRSILGSHQPAGVLADELIERLRALCGPVVDPIPKFFVRLR